MERDQAAQTGYETSDFNAHGLQDILASEPREGPARALLVTRILTDLGVRGRVAFAGSDDAGKAYALMTEVGRRMPEIEPVGESTDTALDMARRTKDEREVEEIRKAGRGTCEAMRRAREFLKNAPRKSGTLQNEAGKPATLGDVRRILRIAFAEHGLVESSGSIVSGGRDAGVPHNEGDDAMEIVEGMPVLIDIFPRQAGGGYCFDMTRTYVAGRASDEIRRAYAEVREIYEKAIASVRLGEKARAYQEMTCDYFEAKGHVTIRQDPKSQEGYVHFLGHGLGLEVHEKPRVGGAKDNADRIEAGAVFTIEPGLYYPSKGYGIRIEDIVYVHDDGRVENLTQFPVEMELG
jgi:Xaa-Pro aminopeptidase